MRSILFAAVLFILAIAPVPALPAGASAPPAGTCVTCLGPQTNTLWQGYTPLGGFARHGTPLRTNLRLEVLYIDGIDSGSFALQWPIVKALDAFGAWKGVRALDRVCAKAFCNDSSFDFSHAAYRSRYAAFVHVPLVAGKQCVRRLPREAEALLRQQRWKLAGSEFYTGLCWTPPKPAVGSSPKTAPLLLVAGYLQAGVQVVLPSDFETAGSVGNAVGLPFAAIHDALAGNAPTDQVTQAALYEVNAEANLIEAFICRADKMQPHAICGRTVIKKLLKRAH